MSYNLKYKDSIVNNIWEEWKLTNARIVGGRVEIEPGGNMQFIKAPKIEEDKMISQKYKVEIVFDGDVSQLYSQSELMFELHMTPIKVNSNEEKRKFKTITTSAHPNSLTGNVRNRCITYVDAKGGMADMFKVIMRNNMNKDITIVSINVYPSYSVDDNTLSEIEQHIPSILHSTNSDRIIVNGETKLTSMDVGAVMNTNLQVHFMVNGTSSDSSDVVLDLKVDQEHLPYSPLEFTIPAGKFLLSLPVNIMQVESGNNTFEVFMTPEKGVTVDIKPFKVQCTIDGKGMISKSSSAAPSVSELLILPIVDVLEFPEDEVQMSVIQTQCVPIASDIQFNVPFVDIYKLGSVNELFGIEQTRVAEDVWFGANWQNGFDQGENEIFIYNDNVILKQDGVLQFKNSDALSIEFTKTDTWKYGDLFTIELDNEYVDSYEKLTITSNKTTITSSTMNINENTFETVEGYIVDDVIEIVPIDEFVTTDVITDGETFTYAAIIINEDDYNDVKELQ